MADHTGRYRKCESLAFAYILLQTAAPGPGQRHTLPAEISVSPPTHALHAPAPPVPSRGAAPRSELTLAQQRALIAGVAALHGALIWALLLVPAVRQAVRENVPIFVDLIPPQAPPTPPPPPPRVPVVPPRAPALVVGKAAPSPAAAFVVEPPPAEPASPAPFVVAEVPAPAEPPSPKLIPPSGVHYLVPPPLEYPRASRRMGEMGKVLVRIFITEDGLPRQVQVTQSSGHARLDEAAIAAVHKARFKPYTENGRAMAGWAFIPLSFDLEK